MNAANRYQGREGGCSIAQGTRDRGPQKPSDQRHRGVGAIAVLVTVFQHQSVLTYHRIESIDGYFDFWFGVDIFFVVSGFVIVRSLLPTLAMAKTRQDYWRNIVAFWIRRMWRIWPTAWLWTGFIVAAAMFARSQA